MEEYFLQKDITVLCVTATSFPEGEMAAHWQLHATCGSSGKRKFYGIARPGKSGNIVYNAAAEQLNELEAIHWGYGTFTIKKGKYFSEFILNFCDVVQMVDKSFQELLKHPQLDPQGYSL